jgi:adenylate cyclase
MAAVVINQATQAMHQLSETVIFGRNADSTICLPDVRVSRRHAMIREQDEGSWWFYDLGSFNGSYLNGTRVTTTRPLQRGDIIDICNYKFRFDIVRTGHTTLVPITLDTEVVLKPMIIFVSDIKGFTRISEVLAPETVAQAIGTWYGACDQILTAQGASIDKFIGDAVLAYWPDVSLKSRAQALNAAMALRDATNNIHDMMRKEFESSGCSFSCGVALHIGEVSQSQLTPGALTMLGDAVNTTFRLQSFTRQLQADIITSSDFFETWPDWPQGKSYCTPLGRHDIRGRLASAELFAVQSCPGDFT